jgi:hypothetical protein
MADDPLRSLAYTNAFLCNAQVGIPLGTSDEITRSTEASLSEADTIM